MLGQAAVLGKGLDIAHELVVGDALERVADLGLEISGQIDGALGGEALFELVVADDGLVLTVKKKECQSHGLPVYRDVQCWANLHAATHDGQSVLLDLVKEVPNHRSS